MGANTMMSILTLPHTSAAIWGLEETIVSAAVEYCWMKSNRGSKDDMNRRSLRLFPFSSTSEMTPRILSVLKGVLGYIGMSSGVRIPQNFCKACWSLFWEVLEEIVSGISVVFGTGFQLITYWLSTLCQYSGRDSQLTLQYLPC